MKKVLLEKALLYFCIVSTLSACQHQFELTKTQPTEAALVANSIQNGMQAELEINYLQAYKNLKLAYSQCIAFTSKQDFVFTDSKLEEHFEMGTIFARSQGGAYLSKVLLESVEPHKTRLTLFVPKDYPYASSRFRQEIKRAKGQDTQCNIKIE